MILINIWTPHRHFEYEDNLPMAIIRDSKITVTESRFGFSKSVDFTTKIISGITMEFCEKGFRMITNKDIKENTIVLIDTPFLEVNHKDRTNLKKFVELLKANKSSIDKLMELAPRSKYPSQHSKISVDGINQNESIGISQFARLIEMSKTKSEDHLDYSDHYIDEKSKELVRKFQSNCFSWGNGVSAILLFGSFFNHSCDPNLDYYKKNNQMIFRSARKILKGEELYISYIGNYQWLNHLSRIKLLDKNWNFICTCEKCEQDRFYYYANLIWKIAKDTEVKLSEISTRDKKYIYLYCFNRFCEICPDDKEVEKIMKKPKISEYFQTKITHWKKKFGLSVRKN